MAQRSFLELVSSKNLIVVPIFNEAWNLPLLFERLGALHSWDVLYINDGSSDSSKELLEAQGSNFIDLAYNIGIGGCVQTGLKYAFEHEYDYAVQLDGDGQHPIEALSELLEEVNSNECDIAIGSRFKRDKKHPVGRTRRLGIRILSSTIKVLTGQTILDPTSGYRLFNRKSISLLSENYPQDYPEPESVVFLLKNGLRICEVPVRMNSREGGISSIHRDGIFYMAKVMLSMIMVVLRPKESSHGSR